MPGREDTTNVFYPKPSALRLLSCLLFSLFPHLASARSTTLRRHCPVSHPSANLLATHAYFHDAEPVNSSLWNAPSLSSYLTDHPHSKQQVVNPLYTVNTYFHIVTDAATAFPDSPNYVTDAQIQSQFNTIVTAYTSAAIAFTFMGATRTINSTWASNGDDLSMKTAL